MRDKNKQISDTATYHDFILTLTVPFSGQTAVTTQLSTSSITGRGHDIGYICSPEDMKTASSYLFCQRVRRAYD